MPPLSRPRLTSWFDDGPAPGQPGPAALYGHVDTATSEVPPSSTAWAISCPVTTVDVTRADHRVAVFAVYQRVAEYTRRAPSRR